MAVTWKITDTMYKPQVGEFENVVWQVHWFASDTDGTNHSWAQGHAILATDNLNSETFVPFDSLTESQAIALLHASIGNSHKEELEQAIADAIAEGSAEEIRSGLPSGW